MNYLTREKSMCICQVLCIRPSNRLYIVKYKGSRSVSDLWNIILNIVKVSVIDRVPFELLECHVLKLFSFSFILESTFIRPLVHFEALTSSKFICDNSSPYEDPMVKKSTLQNILKFQNVKF